MFILSVEGIQDFLQVGKDLCKRKAEEGERLLHQRLQPCGQNEDRQGHKRLVHQLLTGTSRI